MDMWDCLAAIKPDLFDGDDLIYHYTTMATLEKLLRDDADLFCTHFGALNDGAEMLSGAFAVESFLAKKVNASCERILWLRECYRRMLNDGSAVVPWIMSFSHQKDSLYQWIAYTDRSEGGVAIGFKRSEIWNAIERLPGCYGESVVSYAEKDNKRVREKGCKLAFDLKLLPCLYMKQDASLIERYLEMYFNPCLDVIKRVVGAGDVEGVSQVDIMRMLCLAIRASSVIKDDSFRHEHEERLIVFPRTESFDDCQIIGGKPRWRTYISETRREGHGNPKYVPVRGMIREIVLSPHGDNVAMRRNLKVLLSKYRMDYCAVMHSNSPYRS